VVRTSHRPDISNHFKNANPHRLLEILFFNFGNLTNRLEFAGNFLKNCGTWKVELGCGRRFFSSFGHDRLNSPGKNFIGIERLAGRIKKSVIRQRAARLDCQPARRTHWNSALFFGNGFAGRTPADAAAYLFSRPLANEKKHRKNPG